jgi:hypothetical protein
MVFHSFAPQRPSGPAAEEDRFMSFHDAQHSASPTDEDERFPGWRVISFVDPAGTGSDLAFTAGLSALNHPELLLWARPTEGFDPGADWLLTHRERSRLLNRWAVELVTGRLAPGAEREERFDGGRTVARFRFGHPAAVSPVHHPYLPANARVISMAWSLLRRAPAAPTTTWLSPVLTRRMERWITKAEAMTAGRQQYLDPPEQAAAAATAQLASLGVDLPGQERFGLMTRWVNARITQVLSADAAILTAFLERLQMAEYARCEDCLLEDLSDLATRSERNDASREASRAAQDLGLAVTGLPGRPTERWRRAVAGIPTAPELGGMAETGLRTALSDGLEVLLMSAVLADVAPAAVLTDGTGPWAWATSDRRIPGREWLAKPAIRRAARDLLAPVTAHQLVSAVNQARQSTALSKTDPISCLISGLQSTTAASAPPGTLLPRDQLRGLPRSVLRTADQLAGQLVTVMALPHRFPAESWERLRPSLQPLVPALPFELPVELP